jgi:NADH-quinone oxidoreductase subunit I
MAYNVDNRPPDLREQMYFPEIVRGIGIAARHFFKNLFWSRDANPDILARGGRSQVVTVQYPEEKIPYPPGYRGLHRLVPREDGRPRCVACYMCATACPAQCIYIEAGEYPDDPIEKYPTKFVIDELRCVVCGFCVEACPKDAIRMDSGEHAPPSYERGAQIWDEKRLLRGSPSIPAEKLAELRARARPFPTVATDEASQTPGFSVRALAQEARERAERSR